MSSRRKQAKAAHSPTKLVVVDGLDAGYGNVQVLFGVTLEIEQGSVVALLGTNGAGKSTLLKTICGVVRSTSGSVAFGGSDITNMAPHKIAALGISQVPGGVGVFPSLSVGENLRVAAWLGRRDRDATAVGRKKVLDLFPVLDRRLDEPAANLSGGQQQMLALAMGFLSKPRLLLIDELSLGLAPLVVAQLLKVVRQVADEGTTVVLVEQSVNVALTVADTAYFMEKGEIRFSGRTTELLERPDVLRSVFFEGATGVAEVVLPDHVEAVSDSPVGATAASSLAAPSAPSASSVSSAGVGGAPPLSDAGSNGARRLAAEPARSTVVEGSGVVVPGVTPEPGDDGAIDLRPADEAGRAIVLDVVGATRNFGGIRAVDDVSIQVTEGEIVGIIGPNGAGKTTVFDLISGYLPVDRGRIRLHGRDITSMPTDRRARAGLGRSFQDARLFPGLTVAENLAVSLERWLEVRDPINAALHLPANFDSEVKASRKVNELIELFGLGAYYDKFLRELSTGTRRVVDLACIVAHRPKVLLLDEPSSGIAQRETEALGPVILRLRRELGCSIVVIEHDMPLISAISDRMVAMDQGKVLVSGRPDEVLHHPWVLESYLGVPVDAAGQPGETPTGATARPGG